METKRRQKYKVIKKKSMGGELVDVGREKYPEEFTDEEIEDTVEGIRDFYWKLLPEQKLVFKRNLFLKE